MKSLEERLREAQSADAEKLWTIVKDTNPEVISHATLNRHFTDDMAVYIAKRHVTTSETLGFLANDVRFRDSYSLKLAICKNPKSPPRVTLALLKFLRIFDLADISRSKHLPTVLRQKVELAIMERIPTMPSGVKIALTKRANSTIIMYLMERSDAKVIRNCLDSPRLTEGHLHKIINKPATKAMIITAISEHPKWSLRYLIRFGLIRNFHTPMSRVIEFLQGMKTGDLKELYGDPKVPNSTKPFIHKELMDRAESTEIPKEEIYDLNEDDDRQLDDTWKEIH